VSYFNIISSFKNHFLPTDSCSYYSTLFPIFFIAIVLGFFSVTEIHFIDHVKAQHGSQVFRVNVEVTNNGNTDEYGTVYVNINDSPAVDGLGGQLFPAGETVSFEFVFDPKEVPIGKEFVAEVVYGDDIHKRVYGINTSHNSSETITINIP
jgi:hypothetical protein